MIMRTRMPEASYLINHLGDKTRKFTQDAQQASNEHLEEAGESYFQHLRFTVTMAVHFIAISFVLVVHGLLPFLFTRTASRHTERLYRIMKSRTPQSPHDTYDI